MSSTSFQQADMTPAQETMDRGSSTSSSNSNNGHKQKGLGTDAMKDTLQSCETMEIRQDRRGCLQECFCCLTKSNFRYLIGGKTIAKSKEEFSFVQRCCVAPCHSFDMTITDNSNSSDDPEEFLEVNRPFRCCLGPCKCCCNQETTIFSGDDHLGDIRESFWCFVPQFKVYDDDMEEVYVIRPPTCCNGMCIDCTGSDGNPVCPHGCCMVPCDIYPRSDLKGVDRIGRMAKIPKETFRETFNETNYYKIEFPDEATTNEKGLLLGSSILINALYFENSE
mmetsp:Transcript_41421/g.46255  ORF Transcript_41421/g.46255 Transcript_41421/m.46255 type:complete len:279 (+) Transcript_41421:21-857(+)